MSRRNCNAFCPSQALDHKSLPFTSSLHTYREVPSQATKAFPLAPVWVMVPAWRQLSSVITTRSGPGEPFINISITSFASPASYEGLTASVDTTGDDRELLERTTVTVEVEALVVVVPATPSISTTTNFQTHGTAEVENIPVRVARSTGRAAAAEVVASRNRGSVDLSRGVVLATACRRGAGLEDGSRGRGSADGCEGEEEGAEGDLHFDDVGTTEEV